MDNKDCTDKVQDYMDTLYGELRATREQLLQARLAIVGVNAWLEAGERDDWRSPTFPKNALKELRTWRKANVKEAAP